MNPLKAAVILAAIAFAPAAHAAPQSFYGKTLRVTWNEARSQRLQGDGAFKSVSIPLSFTVYVSTQGQLFKRLTSTTASGRHSGSKDRVGNYNEGADGAGAISFQGNTLTSTANNHGLGRRIRVTFDGGSSCRAEVLTGKAGSGVTTVRSNATGKMLELESVSAGAASCSVQDGNAFAS
jgi:cytochrome c1